MARLVKNFLLSAVGAAAITPFGAAAQSSVDAITDEIVVTARKKEEGLSRAPLAVSAMSGDALEFRGVTSISRLEQITPNLSLFESPTNSNVPAAAVYIRGVGQNDFVPVIDPTVGIYVDGVYLGRTVGAVLDIVDLERAEVLRGPQGTLFGRNTIGGAISLISKKPGDEFGGKVDVKYGTDARMDVRGALNIPLTDTLATRFSFGSFQQDGYVTRQADGIDLGNRDRLSFRGAARWQPADDFEFNVAFDYSRIRENGAPLVLTGIQPINFGLAMGRGPSQTVATNTIAAQLANGGIMPNGEFFNPVNPVNGFPFNFMACFAPNNAANPSCYNTQYIDNGDKNVSFGTDPTYSNLNVYGGSWDASWDIADNLNLKYIGSYRTMNGLFAGDQDGAPQRVSYLIDDYKQKQTTHELNLGGKLFNDRLDWITGAYFFHERGFDINEVYFAQVSIQSGGYFKATSWALFGQGTFHVTDKLDLTAGVRYTDENRKYLPDQYFTGFPIGPLPFTCPPGQSVPPAAQCGIGDRVVPLQEVKRTTQKAVPMVNLSYQWTDGLMTYAMYSQGFRSGGFTQRIFPPEPNLPDFNPEYVDSYEGGFKLNTPNNTLRLSAAGFFTDYKDMQLLVSDPSRFGPFVTNAGDAHIYGGELEFMVNPGDGWVLTGSSGLTITDRTRLSGGVQGLTLNSPFEHVSKWTANLQLYKAISLGAWGELTPRAEWSYRSRYGTVSNNIPRTGAPTPTTGPFAGQSLDFGIPNPALVQNGFSLINLSARWHVKDSGVAVTAGVDNVTDKQYRTFGNFQDGIGMSTEAFDRGRQWYVSASYEF